MIPSPLAYGPAGTFDPRRFNSHFQRRSARRSQPSEAFLSQLVWPDLLNEDFELFTQSLQSIYGQMCFKLPVNLGQKGSSSDDEVTVTAPTDDWPHAWPLIALAGDGDDQLLSKTNPAILFGEWGNDSLTAGEVSYTFLDGGEGNDKLETSSIFTWARGGSGVDDLILPVGDWRLLGQNFYGEAYWYELGRLEEGIGEDTSPDRNRSSTHTELKIELSSTD